LLDAIGGCLGSLFPKPLLLFLVLGVRDFLVGSRKLLRAELDQELGHDLTLNEHIVALGAHILTSLVFVVEPSGAREILVVGVHRVELAQLVL